MKKNIIAYLLLSSMFVSEGLATWMGNDHQKSNFDFLPSVLNTTDSISSITLWGESVIFTRNDSVIASETDSASFDLVYAETPSNLDSKMMGQATYDTASATLYYANNGKLYSINTEKKSSPKALVIEGVTNVRHDFENSSIACRNWRYKERDTVKIYNPAIANGGSRIYFSAEMEGGMGGRDIWFIDKIEGKSNKWSKPQNVSRLGLAANDTTSAPTNNINSAKDEDHPFLENDSTLVFSSNRKAKFAGWNLFSAEIKEGAKADLYACDNINSDGDEIAYVKTKRSAYVLSNRDGKDNIFCPYMYVVAKDDAELLADVTVKEPTEEVANDGKEIAENKQNSLTLEKGENAYTLYFKFNEDVMIENYGKEIDEIVAYINNSPKSKFSIFGHTDHIGSQSYNQNLSLKRAKRIYDLLVEKGINKKQLKYKGFGSSQPKVKDAVSEEDLQKNRRVEIIRVGK